MLPRRKLTKLLKNKILKKFTILKNKILSRNCQLTIRSLIILTPKNKFKKNLIKMELLNNLILMKKFKYIKMKSINLMNLIKFNNFNIPSISKFPIIIN